MRRTRELLRDHCNASTAYRQVSCSKHLDSLDQSQVNMQTTLAWLGTVAASVCLENSHESSLVFGARGGTCNTIVSQVLSVWLLYMASFPLHQSARRKLVSSNSVRYTPTSAWARRSRWARCRLCCWMQRS